MKNNSDVLDNARNLGYSITQSVEYKDLLKAEEDYYNDPELTELLKQLENMKEKYNSSKNNDDTENEINRNRENINELQEKINQNKSMVTYTDAKDKYDEVFKSINNLITYITDGQSRLIIETGSDKKDCSECSGCSSGCSK